MGDFSEEANKGFGQNGKLADKGDKTSHHEIGDEKGEGGQRDITEGVTESLVPNEQVDKSAFHQIGDHKGEGGQADIRMDSVETSQGGVKDGPSPTEVGGAEGSGPAEKEPAATAPADQASGVRQQGDEDLDEDGESSQSPT